MTDAPMTPNTGTSDPSESPPAEDRRPWDAADQLEADLDSIERAAYLMMSDAMNAVRELPGIGERGVDIEDPVLGPDRVMLRFSPYDYLDNHLPDADVVLTAIQEDEPGDGDGAGSERWLYSHSGKPVSVAAAALCLAVPHDSLKQAIELLQPSMRAALMLWRERSPRLLARAERHAADPHSAGGQMDRLLNRIRQPAYPSAYHAARQAPTHD